MSPAKKKKRRKRKKKHISSSMEPTGAYLEIEPAIDMFRSEKIEEVLVVGCGNGRHLKPLQEEGFTVHGCDWSAPSVRMAAHLVPEASLHHSTLTKLPFEDRSFKALICYDALQQGRMKTVKTMAGEIERVLSTGGYLYLRVPSLESPETELGKEVEPGTRKNVSMMYGEKPRHYFTEEELKSLFSRFKILSLRHEFHPTVQTASKVGSSWVMIAKRKRAAAGSKKKKSAGKVRKKKK